MFAEILDTPQNNLGDFTISHIVFYFFTSKILQSTIVLLKEIRRQFHAYAWIHF